MPASRLSLPLLGGQEGPGDTHGGQAKKALWDQRKNGMGFQQVSKSKPPAQRKDCASPASSVRSLAGPDPVMQLQRSLGNQAVLQLLKAGQLGGTRPTGARGEAPPELHQHPGQAEAMPLPLRGGLEQLSGLDLSSVRVHRNSSEPGRLDALAYTHGRDIHLAPGQEQQLPHEGWHVVQQMKGRVPPARQAKGVPPVNDEPGLEREADVMGRKATQQKAEGSSESGVSVWASGTSGSLTRPIGLRATVATSSGGSSETAPVQLAPDKPKAQQERYKNEGDFLRAARVLYETGRLAAGVAIHEDDYWGAKAIGLSEDSFYVGLPSDMGTIAHVYKFKGTDGNYEHHVSLGVPTQHLGVPTQQKTTPPAIKSPMDKEATGAILDAQLDFWYGRVESGIDHADLKGDDDGAKYFWLAMAGNLVWAGTAFVAPEATLAIKTMSVGGAVVGAGTIEKLASSGKPVKDFRDMAKTNLGKVYKKLKTPKMIDELMAIYRSQGYMDKDNSKQVIERRRVAWKYLFGDSIGFEDPNELTKRARSDIEAVWKAFLPGYESMFLVITPEFIRKNRGKYSLVYYYRALVISGVADRALGVRKEEWFGFDARGNPTYTGETTYKFPGGATARKTRGWQNIWFGRVTATVP